MVVLKRLSSSPPVFIFLVGRINPQLAQGHILAVIAAVLQVCALTVFGRETKFRQ
jgi:hypothetical protein